MSVNGFQLYHILEEIILIQSFRFDYVKINIQFSYQSLSSPVSVFFTIPERIFKYAMKFYACYNTKRKKKKIKIKVGEGRKKIVYLEYEYAKVNPSACRVQRMQNDAKRSCQVMCTARHKWQAIRHVEGLFKIRRWIFQRFVLNRNDLIFIRMGEKDIFWKGMQWFVSRD